MKKHTLIKALIPILAVLLCVGGVTYLLTKPILSDAMLCDPDRIELVRFENGETQVSELGYFDGRDLLRVVDEMNVVSDRTPIDLYARNNYLDRVKSFDQIHFIYDEVQKTDRVQWIKCTGCGGIHTHDAQNVRYDSVRIVMEEKMISALFLLEGETVDYWFFLDSGAHALRNVFSDFCD